MKHRPCSLKANPAVKRGAFHSNKLWSQLWRRNLFLSLPLVFKSGAIKSSFLHSCMAASPKASGLLTINNSEVSHRPQLPFHPSVFWSLLSSLLTITGYLDTVNVYSVFGLRKRNSKTVRKRMRSTSEYKICFMKFFFINPTYTLGVFAIKMDFDLKK